MHSIRRAAARAVCSSTTVAVPRQQVASFAMQISKANSVRPATMLTLARQFSQTVRVAQDDKSAVEDAIRSTEETGSTIETAAADSTAPQNAKNAQIFISNMTFDVSEAHLLDAFSKYGEITDHNIGRDGRGLSRGFAFVTFSTVEAAQKAVEEANQSFWHGRRILVDYRKQRERGQSGSRQGGSSRGSHVQGPTNSIYIGNIPYETSDADLNNLFRQLDNVFKVRVAVDRNTGWPRGFAHVDFLEVQDATKAFEKLQNHELNGRTLRVDYADPAKNVTGQNKPTN